MSELHSHCIDQTNVSAKRRQLVSRKTLAAMFPEAYAASTLASLHSRGGGPPVIKRGAKVLYDVEVYEQWLTERVFNNTSQYPKRQSEEVK